MLIFTLFCFTFSINEYVWSFVNGENNFSLEEDHFSNYQSNYGETYPGSRKFAAGHTLDEKILMIFGGKGYSNSSKECYLDDIWEYNRETNSWTFIKGTFLCNQENNVANPDYFDPSNFPAGRIVGGSVFSRKNNLFYIFAGEVTGQEYKNDVWVYNTYTKIWRKLTENDVNNCIGQYYHHDFNEENNLGSRTRTTGVLYDKKNVLLIFGGTGYDSDGSLGDMNDLWQFDVSNREWSWITGSKMIRSKGNFDIKQSYDSSYFPCSRSGMVSWLNGDYFMIFGGSTNAYSSSKRNYFDDVWSFDLNTGKWGWLSGTAGNSRIEIRNYEEDYFDERNNPGGRDDMSGFVMDNKLFIFGGYTDSFYFDGIWMYDPELFAWQWLYRFSYEEHSIDPEDTKVRVLNYTKKNEYYPTNKINGRIGSSFSFFETDSGYSLIVFGGYGTDEDTLSDKLYRDVWILRESFECNNQSEFVEETCTLNGKCVSQNECECSEGYYGEECEIFYCFGYLSNDSDVCSRNGVCIETDTCECLGFSNIDDCSQSSYSYTYAVVIGVILGFCLLVVLLISLGVILAYVCFQYQKKRKQFLSLNLEMDPAEMELEMKEVNSSETEGTLLSLVTIRDNTKIETIKLLSNESRKTVMLVKYEEKLCVLKTFFVHDLTETTESLKREIEFLSRNKSCEKIVNFLGVYGSKNKIGFLLEYGEMGNLREYCEKYYLLQKEFIPTNEKTRLMIEILNSLHYFHENKMIHGNLNDRNIIIFNKGNTPKLMDFAFKWRNKRKTRSYSKVEYGNFYQAPEITLEKDIKASTDFFSFGMLMYCIYTNNWNPFKKTKKKGIEMKLTNPDFRPSFDDINVKLKKEIEDLIVNCWKDDPSERYGYKKIHSTLEKYLMKPPIENPQKIDGIVIYSHKNSDLEKIKKLKKSVKKKIKIISESQKREISTNEELEKKTKELASLKEKSTLAINQMKEEREKEQKELADEKKRIEKEFGEKEEKIMKEIEKIKEKMEGLERFKKFQMEVSEIGKKISKGEEISISSGNDKNHNHNNLENELRVKEKELEKFREYTSELFNENENFRKERENIKKKKKEIADFNLKKEDVKKLDNLIRKKKIDVLKIKKKIKKLERKSERFNIDIYQLKNVLTNSNVEKIMLEKQIDDIKNNVDSKKIEELKMKKKIKRLDKEREKIMEEMRKESEKKATELVKKLDKENKEKNMVIEDLLDRLERHEVVNGRKFDRIEERIKEMARENSKLKTKIKRLQEKKKELKGSIYDLKIEKENSLKKEKEEILNSKPPMPPKEKKKKRKPHTITIFGKRKR